MKGIYRILILIFCLSLVPISRQVFAQSLKEDKNDLTQQQEEEKHFNKLQQINKNQEKNFGSEKIIYDFNTKTGVKDLTHYTGDDSNIFGLNFQTTPNVLHAMQFLGFEVSFSHRWGDFWPGIFFSRTMTQFGKISENPPVHTPSNPDDEGLWPRSETDKETLTLMGAGAHLRFKFFEEFNFLSINDLFQTTGAYLTRITMDDQYRSQSYQGFGLRAEYGLHKRTSSNSHLGFKGSYNLGEVKRGQISEKESSDDRRLTVSWISWGVDLSFYF